MSTVPTPQNVVQPAIPVAQIPKKPTRTFTALESVVAWLSFLAGYLFCRVFPVNESPLGGFLFIVGLFVATTVFLLIKKTKFPAIAIAAAVSAVVVSLTLILNANAFLNFFAYVYALITYCYFVYSATGNSVKQGFADLILIDYFKALFVAPFYSIGQLFRAMFSKKASGKLVLKILIGVFLAIIPTTIVLVLLLYDNSFRELLKSIFDSNWRELSSHLGSIILGVPIGMYVFGLFVSSLDKKCTGIITEQSCKNTSKQVKIAPIATILAAVVPLLIVYVIFFISQWQYYISGFTGVLPARFSYAQYAREGFFQLCTVSVINLVMIVAVVLFTRRKTEKPPVVLKILSVIFSVFTLILISTAIAKMVMYIDYYGLTQKRVYATWMMAVLAVVFILIAVRQFVPKFPALATSVAVCVLLFAVLSLSNVDGMIARYNVDRYLDGSLDTVDIAALVDLGDPAVPEMVRLEDELQRRVGNDMEPYKEYQLYFQLNTKLNILSEDLEAREQDVFTFTLPSLQAKKALANR